MHPILFYIGSFPVRSFGLMLMVGFIVAILIACRRANRFNLTPAQIQDSAVWIIILGVLFARLAFIGQEWKYYQNHTNEIFKLQMDGLTSFGGLLGGAIGVFLYSKFKGLHPLQLLDTIGVPMLVASAIGRVGCLLNGCCYGFACQSSPPGVSLSDGRGGTLLGPNGEPYFIPAQLLDSALALFGVLVITQLERRGKLPQGGSLGWTFIAYGLARFTYEFIRFGQSSEVLPGIMLTHAQLAAGLLAFIGLVILLWARRRKAVEVS
ncbi:MAG: prolipoprotein diacylglyceryl transferase [Chthonomonas sp.]|nr:prolipoprotein diacylglyceryl transferase [Chthonomonas sp.]